MSTQTVAPLNTRKGTGIAPWPITLLAGGEKSGKSWACAVASASPMVGQTFWIGIGEDDPDEYTLIPGADFDIVIHDGSYRQILAAILAANTQPDVDGLPTLLVGDSMTKMWDLLVADVQELANARARKKAEKYHNPIPAEDVQITMDLWNVAKDRWGHIMDALRAHKGPVILTARLETVTVMDSAGKPTTEKAEKIKAEKSLPYDVSAIVEMPTRGKAFLTGVRSVRLQLPERQEIPKFTVEALWKNLGLGETTAGARIHSGVKVEREEERHLASVPTGDPGRDWIGEAAGIDNVEALRAFYSEASAAGVGQAVKSAIAARGSELAAAQTTHADTDEPVKPARRRTPAKPEDVAAAEASWGPTS